MPDYSYRNDSTGFRDAALYACQHIVNCETISVENPAIAKIHQLSEVLYAKLLSHCCMI